MDPAGSGDALRTRSRAREAARHISRRVQLPMVSGKWSAAALALCLATSAVLFPLASRLPVWIEAEVVLGIWWVVWASFMTRLLVRGTRLSDDHRLGEPRAWFGGSGPSTIPDATGCLDATALGGDGCAAVLAVLAGIVILAGAAWVAIEVLIPIVAFLIYALLRGMLAHAVNDRNGCQGNLGKSAAWGVLWATAYTAPLAGLVWLAHRVAG